MLWIYGELWDACVEGFRKINRPVCTEKIWKGTNIFRSGPGFEPLFSRKWSHCDVRLREQRPGLPSRPTRTSWSLGTCGSKLRGSKQQWYKEYFERASHSLETLPPRRRSTWRAAMMQFCQRLSHATPPLVHTNLTVMTSKQVQDTSRRQLPYPGYWKCFLLLVLNISDGTSYLG
jgi:hypothetical protein